jgi:hypothetical protein
MARAPIATYRIASSDFAYAPALWELFKASHDLPDKWRFDFLQALTRDRLPILQTVAVMNGHYRTEIDGETLVLHVLHEGVLS